MGAPHHLLATNDWRQLVLMPSNKFKRRKSHLRVAFA
jgi:hypothetical protein